MQISSQYSFSSCVVMTLSSCSNHVPFGITDRQNEMGGPEPFTLIALGIRDVQIDLLQNVSFPFIGKQEGQGREYSARMIGGVPVGVNCHA